MQRKLMSYNSGLVGFAIVITYLNILPQTDTYTRPSDRVRKKKEIVRVFGGKLRGKKWRLCGNCAGLHNRVNKQIFDQRAQKRPNMEEFLDK